jgi:hypothetical protein
VRTAPSPYPPDWSWWSVKGRQTLISRVHLPVSLTGPASSGSTDASRRCQGCSHPPRHLPDQAALSFTQPLRRPGDEGLSPPLDCRRLVAHMPLSPVNPAIHRHRRFPLPVTGFVPVRVTGGTARRPNSKAPGLTSDRAVRDPSNQQGRRYILSESSPARHIR